MCANNWIYPIGYISLLLTNLEDFGYTSNYLLALEYKFLLFCFNYASIRFGYSQMARICTLNPHHRDETILFIKNPVDL